MTGYLLVTVRKPVLVAVRPVDDVEVVSLGCIGGVEVAMLDEVLISRLLVVGTIAG